MAQTKTKAKKRSAPKRAKSSAAKPSSKSKPKASKAKPKSTSSKTRGSGNGASSSKSRSNGAASKHSNVEAVRHVVEGAGDKAKSAGKTVGKAAGKVKVPLVAGGAALAGAAGGMALAATKKGHKSGLGKAVARRPKIKVDSKDVAKAAKGVGNFSAQVSEIAGGLESAASGRNGKHRSPIEVVLQGLTARR
jgi:hypothetical protein